MREVTLEERHGLGLGLFDVFDPYALAEEHGIPVYSLSSLREWDLSQDAHAHFRNERGAVWSAALMPYGTARMIIENDGHDGVRRRSSVAHELGHHLLEHPFDAALIGADHNRQYDASLEKQALFVSGELLITEHAAKKAAFADWDNAQVARAFKVSEQFAQMRMKGVRVMAQRARQKQTRAS